MVFVGDKRKADGDDSDSGESAKRVKAADAEEDEHAKYDITTCFLVVSPLTSSQGGPRGEEATVEGAEAIREDREKEA